jgi:hypothetical protein
MYISTRMHLRRLYAAGASDTLDAADRRDANDSCSAQSAAKGESGPVARLLAVVGARDAALAAGAADACVVDDGEGAAGCAAAATEALKPWTTVGARLARVGAAEAIEPAGRHASNSAAVLPRLRSEDAGTSGGCGRASPVVSDTRDVTSPGRPPAAHSAAASMRSRRCASVACTSAVCAANHSASAPLGVPW